MTDSARRVVATCGAAVIVMATASAATWNDGTSAAMAVDSGTLVSATGLGASAGCVLVLPRVTLSWTPTASTGAAGYRVYRRTGAGSFSLIATVPGRSSTGYTDTPLATSTSYTYYVETYVGAWTASTGTVSATTPAICL